MRKLARLIPLAVLLALTGCAHMDVALATRASSKEIQHQMFIDSFN